MSEHDDVISLQLIDSGVTLDTWTSYYFNSNFLLPTDGFHFTVAAETISDTVRAALLPGASVQLRINGQLQCSGYIDTVTEAKERDSGTEFTIEGRDVMAPAVDANQDPRVRFAQGSTLEDFLKAVFIPFGFSEFVITDDDNVGVMTGQKRGQKTTKKGKPLKNFQLHQLKPYPHEGAYAFAARITQRKGLWLWPQADGQALVVGTPDFDSQAIAQLRRNGSGSSNVTLGVVRRSMEGQPSVIIAQGFGGGGEFERSRMTAYAVNPAVADGSASTAVAGLSASVAEKAVFAQRRATLQKAQPLAAVGSPISDELIATIAAHPDAVNAYPGGHPLAGKTDVLRTTYPRIMFLHDDESKTPDELANFVRRELSLRVRKAFEANYTVDGHTYETTDGVRIPWCVNTMVDVQDDVAGVHEALWVMSRTFSKNRTGGTHTMMELIRPHTLVF